MVEFLLFIGQVHKFLLVEVAQIGAECSACLEERRTIALVGVVVVYLNLVFYLVGVGDVDDLPDSCFGICPLVETLDKVGRDSITAEAAQPIGNYIFIVLPNIFV